MIFINNDGEIKGKTIELSVTSTNTKFRQNNYRLNVIGNKIKIGFKVSKNL